VLTARLEVRLPKEGDRARFVELFCDDDFMLFSSGALDAESASMHFDGMLQRSKETPFAKQPVVERSTGVIVGYSGVDWFDFEGEQRLELGYRLVPQARGMGYATEASLAVLSIAAQTFPGELLAIIHPENVASNNVAEKLGFVFWKQAGVDGHLRNISRRPVPAPHL
jgi:RimJ/RimL family protein N-acetyltransferase